jgi:exodeoxyribonuclease VII large subunit
VESAKTFFSLSRIIGRIEELLRPAMEKTFWLKAEVSSGRQKGQNFYCDLVETEESGRVKAQVRCTIWGSELSRIKQRFRDQGLDLQLDDGTMVGMLCRVQFHPVYGLSLRGIDLDPALALGEMEIKKRAIIERLKAEGLDQLNKKKKLCLLPQRIGLITSDGSAAYYDFMQTLISTGYGFSIEVADANMQGERTEASVLRSLEALSKIDLDLVVICRGGGSKTDLFWLDNEPIARAIAHHPHPVWTGIGHEIDMSVLDLMAHQSFKTPTAIAEELAGAYDGMATRLEQARHQLQSSWNHRWRQDSSWLGNAQEGLQIGVRKLLTLQRSRLDHRMEGLRGRVQKGLEMGFRHIVQAESKLLSKSLSYVKENRHQVKERSGRLGWSVKSRVDLEMNDQKTRRSRFKKNRLLLPLLHSRQDLERRRMRLTGVSVERQIEEANRKLLDAKKILRAHDPARTLDRGFAILESETGEPMNQEKEFSLGNRIRVRMKNRVLLAKIEGTEERKD